MKIKQLSITFLALLVLATAVIPANAAIEVEGDAYIGISNMYLWRGFDLSNSDPVVQGGMDASFKGLTLSYWSNLDLNSNELNETDFTVDYSTDLNEKVSLSIGNIFYALDGLDDTNELYLGLSLNTLLSPALTVYYDYDEAQEDGLFFTLAVGHDLEINKELSLSLGALISYNQKSDYAIGNYSGLHNYELSVSGDYSLSEQLSISPFLIYSDALSDTAETVIENQMAGGINLTLTF